MALGGLDRLFQQTDELGPVRQVGQGVPIRQPADLVFALGDTVAHAVKRRGQRADFVGTLEFDLSQVVAALEPAGGVGRQAQWLRNALGGEDAGNRCQQGTNDGQ